MDVACFSETLVIIYDITWCYNPEDHSLIFHLCESERSLVIAGPPLPLGSICLEKFV
jgi:hypothetical protein